MKTERPLASILIPSRWRFDKLVKCIQSVHDSATGTYFEVVVRFHNDDQPSLDRVSELSEFGNVRVITGETFEGYKSLDVFCNELERVALGEWHWHINNDMVVTGEGWDEKLALMPINVLVQPEIHRLNDSFYPCDPRGPAPIYHKDALERCGEPIIKGPPDITIYRALVEKAGWEVRFLEGIGIWHQWEGHDVP